MNPHITSWVAIVSYNPSNLTNTTLYPECLAYGRSPIPEKPLLAISKLTFELSVLMVSANHLESLSGTSFSNRGFGCRRGPYSDAIESMA